MKQPNILLITDDQHRWDLFDNRTVTGLRTPNLDRLRSEGVAFPNAVTNCPICMPTRFTWVHGLYASQVGAGLMRNALDWPTGLPSMPGAVQAVGYRTALIGKLHSLQGLYDRDVCDEEEVTRARGFEHVHEVCGKALAWWHSCNWTRHLDAKGLLETYRQDAKSRIEMLGGDEHCAPSLLSAEDSMDGYIGAKARAWLSAYDDDAPFFLHASFCGPHFPIDPPEPYASRHRPEDMPDPVGVSDPERIAHWKMRMAAYCGMIEQIDDEVGRLLAILDERGLADNTLVVFTTDHGDMMGHHDRAHKGQPFDTSLRTPLIARLPGRIPAGSECIAPIEAVDLPASLISAAGIETPIAELLPHSPGRSWFAHACGEGSAPRDWAYSEFHSWRMVRDANCKYVWYDNGSEQLFDLATDPWERENLIDEAAWADRLSLMRFRLMQSLTACVAPAEPPPHG